jgi:hypothetical protein
MFENEPGVLIVARPKSLHRRAYRSIRIPRTVYERVIRRITRESQPKGASPIVPLADSSSQLDPTEKLADRRNFLQLLLSAPAAPFLIEVEGKPAPIKCGICGSFQVLFDNGLDINVCRECGAHETPNGWHER